VKPAFSVIFFTTLAGSAQGLVVTLALAVLLNVPLGRQFPVVALLVAELLLLVALASSFLHIGNRARAWRAILMWRTSWMSREVIVLPALIAVVGAWLAAETLDAAGFWRIAFASAAIVMSVLLWLCTAMIYACLRFIQEWAHPLTVSNYTLIGLSSGLILAGALASAGGEARFAAAIAPWALAATLAAGMSRMFSLRRNAALRPRSTLQSATGIRAGRLVQLSMGMSAGSFNTREFFHRASAKILRNIRAGSVLLGFLLPALLLAWIILDAKHSIWLLIVPLQYLGLVAERWYFFAEARHPQNLYYQVVG